jgi:hypothetical protein
MGKLRAVLPVLMIYYIVKKSDKKYEKKVGWMKKIAADFAIVDEIAYDHALAAQHLGLREFIKKRYGEIPGSPGTDMRTREYAIRGALTHTITSHITEKRTFTKASKMHRNGTYSLA